MTLAFPVAAMAIIVVASNIGVQFPIGGGWLTWGAFTYPLAFLVTDVTIRLRGAGAARRVVLAGFGIGMACSLIGTQIEGAYGPLVTWRIALASGVAFLAAQMLDVAIFRALPARPWWRAPLASSVLGSALDTALFFTLAFSMTFAWIEPGNDVSWAQEATAVGPYWVALALADGAVKLGVALAALIPFRLITRRRTQSLA
jgi:uncharacterized integral membrane protein (TIGR00697 family)